MLAITFTRKAADEIRSRISILIGWQRSAGLIVCNFHQLCLRILQAHYQCMGFTQRLFVLGAEEQQELIKECIEEWKRRSEPGQNSELSQLTQDVDTTQINAEEDILGEILQADHPGNIPKVKKKGTCDDRVVNYFLNFIRKSKANQKGPHEFLHEHRFIYEKYVRELKQRSAIDFNDMIPLTLQLFRKRPDVLDECQRKFHYIFIDEFQDVTQSQLDVVVLLAGRDKFITVCGDDDQSIYGWRGASKAFTQFRNMFPGHNTIVLNQTYRSTQTIVKTTSGLIANNMMRNKKQVWTANELGDPVCHNTQLSV